VELLDEPVIGEHPQRVSECLQRRRIEPLDREPVFAMVAATLSWND
jgi:hypothetical protein